MINILKLLILVMSAFLVSEGLASEALAKNVTAQDKNNKEIIDIQLRLAVEHLPLQWANALDNLTVLPTELIDIFSKKIKNEQVVHFEFYQFTELKEWYKKRRNKLLTSSHTVKNIKLVKLSRKKIKLDFEYIIEEQFKNSPLHIIRLKQNWLIDTSNTQVPVVIEMQESYLPPKINSGAKIQC